MATRADLNSFLNDGGTESPARRAETVRTLLLAAAVTVALYFVPYAGFITYPLRLLVTFLHEGGHAMAALLTGGAVNSIHIQPDGSGLTYTRGGLSFLISSAGYLGATLYGAGLLALLRRGVPGRTLLLATAAYTGLLTLFFVRPWNNLFGFGWGVGLAVLLGIAALRLPARQAGWLAAFVGVQCVLNALFDLRTLMGLSWMPGAPATDAANMARMTWIPAPFWAGLWIALAAAMLWVTLLRPARRSPGAAVSSL